MTSILIKNGTVLTMDETGSMVRGDLLVQNGRITRLGESGLVADVTIDATDCAVIPGFVQTHIHLCQTIFRGAADDLSLIDWLKKRVWPMEAAHNERSIRASARLGVAELIKGGTTCALTMETVNHTDQVFRVIEETGFRATVGKCMMDKGEEVPAALHEQTKNSIEESLALLDKWHNSADGRIRYCFAPRFAVSCTRELLERVGSLAREKGVMVHTHASENLGECAMVEAETGMRNVAYLDSVRITGPHVALAHCVHLSNDEKEILRTTRTNVVHCPSSNLKLGSGIAEVQDLLKRGISVSIGADGAACNNRLDMFTEMRTAALLQKGLHGPEALNAYRSLQLATSDGARAMGLDSEIGTLEVGKRADLSVVRLDKIHSAPRLGDVASALVYAAQATDVTHVLIDGNQVLVDGWLQTMTESSVVAEVADEAPKLRERAGILD